MSEDLLASASQKDAVPNEVRSATGVQCVGAREMHGVSSGGAHMQGKGIYSDLPSLPSRSQQAKTIHFNLMVFLMLTSMVFMSICILAIWDALAKDALQKAETSMVVIGAFTVLIGIAATVLV